MDQEQVKYILFKASAAYPNQLELEDETIAVWIERLAGFPFEQAKRNLNQHIDSSRFFPTIAEIMEKQPARQTDGHLQAAEQLLLLEGWSASKAPPPEGYWLSMREKLGGDNA